MTRRSTAKKIDYCKFATSGSSTDDDDFENNLPPKKKKKEKNLKEEKKCKDSSAKSIEHKEKSKLPEKKTRKSRTSNAEQNYEEDLLQALEASKNVLKINQKDVDKKIIINLDSDSDEDKIMKLIASKRLTSTTEGTESEDSAFADTLPMNKHRLTTDTEEEKIYRGKVKSKGQRLTTDTEEEKIDRGKVKSKGQSLATDIEEEKIDFGKGKSIGQKSNKEELNESSKRVEIDTEEEVAGDNEHEEIHFNEENTTFTKVTKHTNNNAGKNSLRRHNDNHITTKLSSKADAHHSSTSNTLTPVRLRLGLSRKSKVTKPLHQNVSFTNIT